MGALLAPAGPPALAGPPAPAPRPSLVQAVQAEDDTPLIMRLFGFRRRPVEERMEELRGGPQVIEVPPAASAPRRPSRPSRPAPPPEPEIVIQPKDPDAKIVLVVGDGLAADLGEGLRIAFADTPGIDFIIETHEGSGLAADDPVDWPARVGTIALGPQPPDAIVVMIGEGDRRDFAAEGDPLPFGTPRWDAAYRSEVDTLIGAVRRARVPLYWVGLVPFADPDSLADIAFLDEIYRQETSESGAVYIDVWNAFADAAGSFAASGPDVEGRDVRLRDEDGAGFTSAGGRKLAFYVERELRNWLRTGVPVALPDAVAGGGPVLFLNDPEAGPDEELAGAVPPPAPVPGSPLYRLVVEGRPLDPVTGRIDDWSDVAVNGS